jgi:sugar phosphate isomerase/epimerase
MRLGISSYTYTWAVGVPGRMPATPLTAADLVRKAVSAGVTCVQIADNLPLDRLSRAERQELLDLAEHNGIGMEVGSRGLTAENLDRHIDLAVFFKSPILRFVIDGPGFEPSLDEVVSLIRGARLRLRGNKLLLALENHDRFKAEDFRQLVLRTDPEFVGICLDSVNSMGAGEGVREVVDTLGPLAVNLHLKDFTVRRAPHKMGFVIEGLPAGQGMLDVPWLLAEVGRHGRCQSAILELWTPPEPDLAATVEKEARWAEESLAFLRPYFP